LLLGGDLSGKRLIPVIRKADGLYRASEPFKQKDDTGLATEVSVMKSGQLSELMAYRRHLEAKGYYVEECSEAEVAALNEAPARLREMFLSRICERIVKWSEIVTRRLDDGIVCLWCGGNDDDPEVLEKASGLDLGRFCYAEDEIAQIDGYEVLSFGYSNRTPFNTKRELDEHDIYSRLAALQERLSTTERLILNVHVPPRDCGSLDACLGTDDPDRMVHVGSTAVRSFIENLGPLAAFTGHVHEGKGVAMVGKTVVFNPGSDYSAGILQAFVVEVGPAGVETYMHLCR
jgi:Icc-related predicted phosphoesterase